MTIGDVQLASKNAEAPNGFSRAFDRPKISKADAAAAAIACQDVCADKNPDAALGLATKVEQYHTKGLYIDSLLEGIRSRQRRGLPRGDPTLLLDGAERISGVQPDAIDVFVHKNAPKVKAANLTVDLNKVLVDVNRGCLPSRISVVACGEKKAKTSVDALCAAGEVFVTTLRPHAATNALASCGAVVASASMGYSTELDWATANPNVAHQIRGGCCRDAATFDKMSCTVSYGDEILKATAPLIAFAMAEVMQRTANGEADFDPKCQEARVGSTLDANSFPVDLYHADGGYLKVEKGGNPKMAVEAFASRAQAENLVNPKYNDMEFDEFLRIKKVVGKNSAGKPNAMQSHSLDDSIATALNELLPVKVVDSGSVKSGQQNKYYKNTEHVPQLVVVGMQVQWLADQDGVALIDAKAFEAAVAEALFFFSLEIEAEVIARAEFETLVTTTTVVKTLNVTREPQVIIPTDGRYATGSEIKTKLEELLNQYDSDMERLVRIREAALAQDGADEDRLVALRDEANAAQVKLTQCAENFPNTVNPAAYSTKCGRNLATLEDKQTEAYTMYNSYADGCVYDQNRADLAAIETEIYERTEAYLNAMVQLTSFNKLEKLAVLKEKQAVKLTVDAEIAKAKATSAANTKALNARTQALSAMKRARQTKISDEASKWQTAYQTCTAERMKAYETIPETVLLADEKRMYADQFCSVVKLGFDQYAHQKNKFAVCFADQMADNEKLAEDSADAGKALEASNVAFTAEASKVESAVKDAEKEDGSMMLIVIICVAVVFLILCMVMAMVLMNSKSKGAGQPGGNYNAQFQQQMYDPMQRGGASGFQNPMYDDGSQYQQQQQGYGQQQQGYNQGYEQGGYDKMYDQPAYDQGQYGVPAAATVQASTTSTEVNWNQSQKAAKPSFAEPEIDQAQALADREAKLASISTHRSSLKGRPAVPDEFESAGGSYLDVQADDASDSNEDSDGDSDGNDMYDNTDANNGDEGDDAGGDATYGGLAEPELESDDGDDDEGDDDDDDDDDDDSDNDGEEDEDEDEDTDGDSE